MGSPLLGNLGSTEVVCVEDNTYEPHIHELLAAVR